MSANLLTRLGQCLREAREEIGLMRISGAITEVSPAYARVAGLSPFLKLGDCVSLGETQLAEVVRIDPETATIKPFDDRIQIQLGQRAYYAGNLRIFPTHSWKGRVVNALGKAVDDDGLLERGATAFRLEASPPPAMRRQRISKPIKSGIRAIDLFTPICAGQRIGIFAGSGVGKSTLLAMLANSRDFDTVVVALVGERGREVREFIDEALAVNRSSTVTVVTTSDESPVMRRLAPKTAMTIAEYFRSQGQSVLLIIDSITRFAHAARDVAMASGELPVARGYTPSVFGDLPKLLERAGPGEEGQGTITGVFSVLVDGDDVNDPVADTIRGILDGHIVLDRTIAEQGRYPAINVLRSISRLAPSAWTIEQNDLVARLRALIARYEDTGDLRLMGGYRQGGDAELDQAIAIVPKIYAALCQSPRSGPSTDAFRELTEFLQTA
ncbi:MAG TPA: flagellar protein export ATPase FliI [Methylocella sp.]|nr:flagellar protein export ATPase FliI [Methylocella sp.]